MSIELPNQYSLSHLPGVDPHVRRVMQDMTDRINFLTNQVDDMRSAMGLVKTVNGMARKESPVEGIIRIPGQQTNGQVRVSKDGVIVSYVNPTENVLPYTEVTEVDSVGAGTSDLHTFRLPAGTLKDGDCLQVTYGGVFASNDTDKAVNAYIDNLVYESTGVLDIDGGAWRIDATIVKTGASVITVSHTMHWFAMHVDSANVLTAFGTGTFDVTRLVVNSVVASNLDTTSILMGCRGIGGANSDVVQFLSVINLVRPNSKKP